MPTMISSQTFELNPTIQCNDLKAFERRLMETILQQKPRERLWRIILIASLTTTAISSYFWLQDSINPALNQNASENERFVQEELTLLQSLRRHYFFTTNCITLIILFLFGIHQRVIQTNIIVSRIREVLYDFALSCDDQGKLIVKQNFSRLSPSSLSVFSSSSTSLSPVNNFNSSIATLNPNQIQHRS
ncbi:hypothetical protein NH340_JMT05718 [Sarcoptes scabiei]|nr:hypothetical protein NH340_JMT05718 [Sarcoptes scabiei]